MRQDYTRMVAVDGIPERIDLETVQQMLVSNLVQFSMFKGGVNITAAKLHVWWLYDGDGPNKKKKNNNIKTANHL